VTDDIPPPPSGGNIFNVAVIGAGATGALAAFELARAGHRVTVFEKLSPGSGSSGRSAACIRQQFGTESTVRGMIYATRFYDAWQKTFGVAQTPVQHNGYLFLSDWSADGEAAKSRVKMQRDAGLEEVEFLDPKDIDVRFPFVQTTGVKFATWCPTDGFLEHDRVYRDALEAAKSLGVQVYQNCGATGADCKNGKITRLHTERGTLAFDVVVNTTNAWASSVSQSLGGPALRITPRKRYLYFVDGPKRDLELITLDEFRRLPMVIVPNDAYCRPTSDGQLLFARLHKTEPIEDPTHEVQDEIERGFRGRGIHDYGPAVHKSLFPWLPFLEELGHHKAVTSGLYADTGDHNPLIGYDANMTNLVHAAGFSGHGLMHAPFTARIVAALVAAGHDLSEIELPLVGSVDVGRYHVERTFTSSEGMVI
jgi:glycine/D-amino acid oxidase-like deaminating enzyme